MWEAAAESIAKEDRLARDLSRIESRRSQTYTRPRNKRNNQECNWPTAQTAKNQEWTLPPIQSAKTPSSSSQMDPVKNYGTTSQGGEKTTTKSLEAWDFLSARFHFV